MRVQGPPVSAAPGRPFANTYWVEPHRLLAGEYPGAANRGETSSRLQNLLTAGIDAFVDLTVPGELPDYAQQLAELAPHVVHRRFPVLDHDVPTDSRFMPAVLDCMQALLDEGRRIYVHCRAGVGRTGTVIGCWLIRSGLQSEAALDRLAELWQQSERSRFIPQVPETAAQAHFVRLWRDTGLAGAGSASRRRIAGAVCGLALGETGMGRAGQWGSNTAMMVILAESLLAAGGHSPEDQMRGYLKWQQGGRPAGASSGAEVPSGVRRAVATWQWTRKPYSGSHDPANLDAHSLARSAAVALFHPGQPAWVLDMAAEASRTTQQAPIVLDACRLFAASIVAALAGVERHALLRFSGHPVFDLLRDRRMKPEIAALMDPAASGKRSSAGRDDVVGELAAAFKAFDGAQDFAAGMAVLAQLSAGSAAAACYGALLGAHDPSALPANRLADIADRVLLEDLARRLAASKGPVR